MAGLSVQLLGPFRVTLDGEPAAGFASNKARALLAYLAAEPARPHARETVAGLLWPDYPQRSAQNSLRATLANVRQVIGDHAAQPPYLLISRKTLQFNLASDQRRDVADLEGIYDRSPEELAPALAGLDDCFLEGFSLSDSPPFEEWLRYKREEMQRKLLEATQHLASCFEQRGDYQQTLVYARRSLALEPWLEEAHRQVMRALALSHEPAAALVQYETCCRILEQELGIAPAPETRSLAEQIRQGALHPPAAAGPAGRGGMGEAPPAPGEAPFKGLNHFEERDAALFFGREALTNELLELVQACQRAGQAGGRFISLIGASGSGKSSVVRAGLLPALRRQGAAREHTNSPAAPFPGAMHLLTPTARPLEALALSLTRGNGSLADAAGLIDDLGRDARTLHLAGVQHLQGAAGGRWLLLLIDQFEELFTLCHDERERQAFLDNLLLAAAASGPVIVLIVLRADFYAQCAPYASLRLALTSHQQYIGAMNQEELRRAIVEPAQQGGWAFEPGLVDLILRDAGGNPGALPHLSQALLATWQRRRGRTLTLSGYQEAGGVQGAITLTAETVYGRLDAEQQAIARRIFLRLTELEESTADEALPALFTRRRASLAELVPHEQDGAEVQGVLLKLTEARLITTSQETAEVAHEALIQEWNRLRRWLADNREALRTQRQLTAAAQEWERLGEDSDLLFRGARLAQVAAWAEANPSVISSQEQRFLAASLAAEEAQQQAEAARQQRELRAAQELAEAQRLRAEEQASAAGKLRRRALWLGAAAGAMLLLLLIAGGLGLLANRNARAAQEQTQLAISRELAASAGNTLLLDPERSILLALQALDTADTLQARNALHQALPELHLLRTIPFKIGGVPGVSFSPDGSRLAAIGVDGEIKVWNPETWATVSTFSSGKGVVGMDLAFSPDGQQLAAVFDSQVLLFDASTGEQLFALPGQTAGTVRRLAFHPDGQQLAVASQDGQPHIWDLTSQQVRLVLSGHPDYCEAIAFAPDGKRLATGDVSGQVKLWNAADGEEVISFEHGGSIHAVTFSPDGSQLAVASDNARLGIYDAESGETLQNIPVRSGIYDVDYMSGGQRLAVAHQDGTTTIWDPLSGQQLLALAGHVSTVISTAPSPDSTTLATSGYDGTVKIWDISPGYEQMTIAAHAEPAYDIAYTPDGARLLTVGFDGTAALWDTASGERLRSLTPADVQGPLSSLALNPDGSQAAIGGWDGTLYLTRLEDGAAVRLPLHGAPLIDLVFSPDGRHLATASWDTTSKVLDTATGEEITLVSSQDEAGVPMGISGVAFSADGRHFFTTGDDNYVHQWDLDTGDEIQRLYSDGLDLYGLAVTPDGKLVAAGRQDGAVLIWDIAQGELVHQLPAHAGLVLRLAFSQDGRKLASVGFDSLAKVWDVQSGEELATLYGVTGNVFSAAFSPDGRSLATAGGDGTVRIYTLELDELQHLARARLTRSLSPEECRVYLHADACPE